MYGAGEEIGRSLNREDIKHRVAKRMISFAEEAEYIQFKCMAERRDCAEQMISFTKEAAFIQFICRAGRRCHAEP